MNPPGPLSRQTEAVLNCYLVTFSTPPQSDLFHKSIRIFNVGIVIWKCVLNYYFLIAAITKRNPFFYGFSYFNPGISACVTIPYYYPIFSNSHSLLPPLFGLCCGCLTVPNPHALYNIILHLPNIWVIFAIFLGVPMW